jgi:hypothetical protein
LDNPSHHDPNLSKFTRTSDVALCFESLGGGGKDSATFAWGFGCEFGFFQRHVGVEPLGLLRWAGIAPEDLIRGLDSDFSGIDDPAHLNLVERQGPDWAFLQTSYKIRFDHSGLNRHEVPIAEAKERICLNLRWLRKKFLEDLAEGEKIFVYRTFDYVVSSETVRQMAGSLGRHGPGKLLYVCLADEHNPVFSVKQILPNLLIGYIDAFAPQNHKIIYNTNGWNAVCREALKVAAAA